MLGVDYENVRIDWEKNAHKSPDFLELNPRGQVPVMEVEDKVLWDSTAHLVYIARKYGGNAWLPTEPLQMAEIMQWMSFAQNEVQFGLQWARGVKDIHCMISAICRGSVGSQALPPYLRAI